LHPNCFTFAGRKQSKDKIMEHDHGEEKLPVGKIITAAAMLITGLLLQGWDAAWFQNTPTRLVFYDIAYAFVALPVVREAWEWAVKGDIFLYRKVIVQRKLLTHIADVLFYLFLLSIDIKACHGSLARSRVRESAENTYGGGFARSVSTKEAEDFAFLDG